MPVRDLWRARLIQTMWENYAGVPMAKLPEDLRVYGHFLWGARLDAVVELGTGFGGSALWLRDRLDAFRRYDPSRAALVVSIDIDLGRARDAIEGEESIVLVEGDIADPALSERVAAALPAGVRCLVIDDGRHTYEATTAALRGFAPFVPPGGWFVVEDGVVDEDELRIADSWPRGVRRAVSDWLSGPDGAEFSPRRDLGAYGDTTNTGGYLKRAEEPHRASST